MRTKKFRRWGECPRCGEPVYNFGDLEEDEGSACRELECDCGFEWREVFDFAHNESLEGFLLDWNGLVIENIVLSPAVSGEQNGYEHEHLTL